MGAKRDMQKFAYNIAVFKMLILKAINNVCKFAELGHWLLNGRLIAE
jgi:hypothetical protein